MNLKSLKIVTAALAIVATAAVSSHAGDQEFLASANLALMEGASSISLRAPRVTSADSWGTIKKKALPDFPVIGFPDGTAYRVDSVCVDGNNLRNKYAKTAVVCDNMGEGACLSQRTVELVTSLDYEVRFCTSSRWYEEDMGYDIGKVWRQECTSYRSEPRRHDLSHAVPVFDTAPTFAEDGTPVHTPKLLFAKNYTIEACAK